MQMDQTAQHDRWRLEVRQQEDEFRRLSENTVPADYVSRMQVLGGSFQLFSEVLPVLIKFNRVQQCKYPIVC